MTDVSEAAIAPGPSPHRDHCFRHFRPDRTTSGVGDIAGDLVGSGEIIRDPDGELRAAVHSPTVLSARYPAAGGTRTGRGSYRWSSSGRAGLTGLTLTGEAASAEGGAAT